MVGTKMYDGGGQLPQSARLRAYEVGGDQSDAPFPVSSCRKGSL